MIRDILNKNLVTIAPNANCREIASLMDTRNVGSVLVVENGRLKGIITDRDIVVRCLSNSTVNLDKFSASDFMTTQLETIKETDGLFDCIAKMKKAHVRRIPVINDEGKAVGILSFGDILGLLSKEVESLAEAATPLGDVTQKEAA